MSEEKHEPKPLTSNEMEAFMKGLAHYLYSEGEEDQRLQEGLEIVKQEISKREDCVEEV